MKIASVMRKKRIKLPTTIPEIASALWLGVKLVKPANLKSFQFHNKRIYVGKQNENNANCYSSNCYRIVVACIIGMANSFTNLII